MKTKEYLNLDFFPLPAVITPLHLLNSVITGVFGTGTFLRKVTTLEGIINALLPHGSWAHLRQNAISLLVFGAHSRHMGVMWFSVWPDRLSVGCRLNKQRSIKVCISIARTVFFED